MGKRRKGKESFQKRSNSPWGKLCCNKIREDGRNAKAFLSKNGGMPMAMCPGCHGIMKSIYNSEFKRVYKEVSIMSWRDLWEVKEMMDS